MNKVCIVGAGGHAKVVLDTCRAANIQVEKIYDEDDKKQGNELLGVLVSSNLESIKGYQLIVAIGNNAARERVVNEMENWEYCTVIHPTATVSPHVRIGLGTVVFAGSIIQTGTHVGRHVIINTAATVDHDCQIDDFVHISPGAHLAGGVIVGRGAWVGIGAVIIQGVTIGEGAVIGAGAAVIRDVEPYTTVVGVPARMIEKHA